MEATAPSHSVGSVSRDCPPLLEAAHLNIYRENTFRITGLPVDATEREIKKRAGKLKMLEELGKGEDASQHAYALKPTPTVEQIRGAMQRLKEPEHRLIDEFFWFWPREVGGSSNDPAIQALENGHLDVAYETWKRLEDQSETDLVACHNLAILYHIAAVEWTDFHIGNQVDYEREKKIRTYWQDAFQRWEKIATDERTWAYLKERVRSLDDARLTTGFVRRMERGLPEALDKINAEAALRFAQVGKIDWAKSHIEWMNETHQGLDDVDKTALLVLEPTRKRVRQLVAKAKDSTSKDPSSGADAAQILVDQCRPLKQLFELFRGEECDYKAELFDEVASQINSSLVQHGKATGRNGDHIDLMKVALELSTAPSISDVIRKNIGIREQVNTQKRLDGLSKPIFDRLGQLSLNSASASVLFGRIRQDVLPMFDAIKIDASVPSGMLSAVAEGIALALRDISIKANNEEKDYDTATKAITLACSLPTASKIKEQLLKDKATLAGNLESHRSNFVDLKLRSDHIEITDKVVRYNGAEIPCGEVSGVRWGVFVQYVNGVRSSVSYHIGISGAGHVLKIECKRFWRSEEQAQEDYKSILVGLLVFVVPGLARRIATAITRGTGYDFGSVKCDRTGVLLKSGMLMWGKEQRFSWDDIEMSDSQGTLTVHARSNPKFTATASLRDHWNAVIFKQVAKAVCEQ